MIGSISAGFTRLLGRLERDLARPAPRRAACSRLRISSVATRSRLSRCTPGPPDQPGGLEQAVAVVVVSVCDI